MSMNGIRSPDDYFDLGSYHRKIDTSSTLAQLWFDRGLIWSYSFNHEEATECFERASEEDPECPITYWGIAYTLGPNYNKPWEVFEHDELQSNLARAKRAVQTGTDKAQAPDADPVAKALLRAIRFRYQGDMDDDRSQWNQDYADAMSDVYNDFPDDLDVAALYADSLMNLTPWNLWNNRTGEPTEGSKTLEAKAVLERAMAQEGGRLHPGLPHLYTHLMEMSTTPEAALNAADCLRNLAPDAGHLHHMPTHLDVLCGDYRRVITSNSDAIRADERWLAKRGALNFYSLYRSHNYHFRIYGALFAGQLGVALATVEQLESSIPKQLLETHSPPMADWLESFLSMRMHVLVRFGRWNEILDLPVPEDEMLYCVTTAMTHYAKGVALAALGRCDEADEERRLFREATKRVFPSRTLFNNTCAEILRIGSAMLDGEIEYRRGNLDDAFGHLRLAIEQSDNMPYDEPWGWMQPPRHAYGALLLEQGNIEEAAAVYSADLGLDDTLPRALQHPNNMWALHGYHECLKRLGHDTAAKIVQKQLNIASATADVPITSSCYCRTNVAQ